MNKAYLLTGSNLGNRQHSLRIAHKLIEANCGDVICVSALYETAAWGKMDQPLFFNQALEIRTHYDATTLLHQLLVIEEKMGRIRNEKFGPRSIDIDIIFFNKEIHCSDVLKIPHPEMQNRRFVLVPLAEIAPAAVHPQLNKTVIELLEVCADHLKVNRIS